MMKTMSLSTSRGLLASIWEKCRGANWKDKGQILDGFVTAVGYDQNHAIQLVNRRTILE